MDAYNAAVNTALTEFTAKYQIDNEIVNDLRGFLTTAGKKHVKAVASTSSSSSTSTAAAGTRRKTAYNVYIKAKFAEAKSGGDGRNSQELMTEFSRQWKDLSAEDKAPYESEAKDSNASLPATTTTGATRKMSGYNLFYKEQKDVLKEEAKKLDVKLMTHVGAAWKALSDSDKKEWNDRAASA